MKTVTLDSNYVHVDEAKLYTRPTELPLVVGSAITPETEAWVASWADAIITTYKPPEKQRTVISCTLVAYGFSRFPIPGKGILFIILVSTIILPNQVTLVPTYAFFASIGWTGTWLPLIVPHFFANAYNVFLLRQYFMTLPRELDEAAMIDGAGPLRVLWSVILPQAFPAVIAVALFHFVFAWNDYFEPLIYLLNAPELQPISVGIQQFNDVFFREPAMLQATSLMALIPPLILFILAQRFFMRGMVVTGTDK